MQVMQADSEETRKLLAEVRAGDPQALGRLLTRHQPYLQRFIERRQGRFACTATAGVGQVGGRDAVLLVTGFAGSYHRHLSSPFALDSFCSLRLRLLPLLK